MVGSTTAEPVGERDRILTSKVKIPRTRPGYLNRPRLIGALDEAVRRELTLVCAPAGFGKTTLLADWAEGADLPVAWLSLEEDDDDPARFWRYVMTSLKTAPLDADVPNLSLVVESGGASEGFAAALIQDLEDLSEDLVVILDDYHTIDSEGVHDSITFLLNHQPPPLHVIISSRADPPLPVAKMRAGDQLAELRTADLRFTPDEGRIFLQEVWELDVDPQAAAELQDRTEGWAAGLQLAALSLRDRPDRKSFIEGFKGTHRYVLDYLSEEVFEAQSTQVRGFLLDTSILTRLSGPLCDAVTGNSDGQDMLERLDRDNLFLIPLDEARRWYRYHRLFGDILRARLQRSHTHNVAELHRRAASWYEQHRLIDEAIRHALAAGDTRWATRLVETNLRETFHRGETVVIERWLSELPQEAVETRPALSLAKGLMLFHLGHLKPAQRLMEIAEGAFGGQSGFEQGEVPTEGGMVASVPAAIALLRSNLASARGEAERSARYAHSALELLTDEKQGPRYAARWLLAAADWMRGRTPEAESAFTKVLADARAVADPYPAMSVFLTLGRVQRSQGKLSAALQTHHEGLALAAGRFSTFHAAEAHVGMAQVLYQRDQLGDAFRHVTKGLELFKRMVRLTTPVLGLVTLAWIRHAQGEVAAAFEAVDEACSLRPDPDIVALWNPGPSERARLWLLNDRVDDAEQWVEGLRLSVKDDVSYPREHDHLMLARVLLARRHPHRALQLLQRLDDLAVSQGRNGSLIEIRALRTLALDASGDHDRALDLLATTITGATPEGYVRVFVDEDPTLARLLRRLAGSGSDLSRASRTHFNRVLRAFDPIESITGDAASSHLIDPLTDREFEVLQLLAAGKRNREIADELYISLDTVKKHVSHILDKLAATNRTEAVAEAVNLGILTRSD